MSNRKLAFSVAAAVAISSGFAVAVAQEAQAASCPDSGWHNYDNITATNILKAGANIRTGPSTTCTSVGQGQTSHSITLHCYKAGSGGYWDHVRDNTTGKSGWVSETAMNHYATNYC